MRGLLEELSAAQRLSETHGGETHEATENVEAALI